MGVCPRILCFFNPAQANGESDTSSGGMVMKSCPEIEFLAYQFSRFYHISCPLILLEKNNRKQTSHPCILVSDSSKDSGGHTIPINPLWVVICVAVPLLLLGVIAFSRKVVARLWQPEGDNRFLNNDMRREPLGQEGDEMT